MVIVDHRSIKEAAEILKLKYSTAKTIFKIFKKENRTFKFTSRSRNPGAKKEAINKIKKAPQPHFMQKFQDMSRVCGIADISFRSYKYQ